MTETQNDAHVLHLPSFGKHQPTSDYTYIRALAQRNQTREPFWLKDFSIVVQKTNEVADGLLAGEIANR
jgi:hypothetical protein